MALNWSWKAKVGTLTCTNYDGQEYEVSLYKGNAYLIEIYEFKEDGKDMYTLHGFFADKEHAKNCLGLSKGHDSNICENWKKIRLSKDYPHLKELTGMLVKAFDEIVIEVYKEKNEEEANEEK